jgi:uncharacterized protein (DUF1778 family)
MSNTASENKEQNLHIRVTPRQKKVLQLAAKRAGLSTSAYVLSQSLRVATEALHDVDRLVLDDTDRDFILKLLEAKPKPSARLKAAFRRASR